VLHLPLRYDDETHLWPIGEAPHGEIVLVEGTVADNAIKYRPKRQLVCTVEDASGALVMRLLNFYPSQAKQARARRARAPLRRKSGRAFSAPRWCTRNTAWCARTRRWPTR